MKTKCLYCERELTQDHPRHFFCKGMFCYHAYADQWAAERRAEGRYIPDTAFGMLGALGFMGDREIIRELHRDIDQAAARKE